jgi:hypothetical protein
MKKNYFKIFLFFRWCRWHRCWTFIREYLREFSQKIWDGPNGLLRGPGDTDLWKKIVAENLMSDSLKDQAEPKKVFKLGQIFFLSYMTPLYLQIIVFTIFNPLTTTGMA